jgi:hypothetical protein
MIILSFRQNGEIFWFVIILTAYSLKAVFIIAYLKEITDVI